MKLTTERLKRLIREELNKMDEGLGMDMFRYGPAAGYVRNKARKEEEPKTPEAPVGKRNMRSKPLPSMPKQSVAKMSAGQLASELSSSNLIASALSDGTVRVKLKDESGKYINKDFNVDQFQTSQEVIDQIQKEFPSAMMQASQKGMRKGDMVDVGDPMMELKKKFLRRTKNGK
jgi:hypothetical protein